MDYIHIICLLYCRMHQFFKDALQYHIDNFMENQVIWI